MTTNATQTASTHLGELRPVHAFAVCTVVVPALRTRIRQAWMTRKVDSGRMPGGFQRRTLQS